jgi:protein-S-isoprenylcysteine O-methyltransferase Ste14
MDMKLRVVWFSWMMMVPFLWFTLLARRTFLIPDRGLPKLMLGGVSMMSGFALAGWTGLHGSYVQALWAGGAILAICSVVLYESARRVVSGRGFYSVLSGAVPSAVCTVGPYRYIRHPVYTSYLLAFLALVIAFPGLPGAAVFVGNLVFFVFAAAQEERTIAHSPLAQAYASYRQVAGMFLPRFGRGRAS